MKDLIHTIKNFLRIYQPLSSKSKLALWIAFVMIVCGSFITSVIPSLTGTIIDGIIYGSSYVIKIVIAIAGLFVVRLITEVIRKYIIERIGTQTQKNLIIEASAHIIQLDLEWLNSQRSGGLNGKLQRSVEGAIKLLKLVTMDFLPGILQMFFAVIVAFLTNMYIGIILLIVVIIGIFIVIKQIESQKGIRISLLRSREENDANIVELLTGIESVRVANEEAKQMNRIEAVNEELRTKEIRHHIKMIFFDSIKSINIMFWNVVILLIGIWLAISEVITPGDIVVFNLLFNNVIIPLQNIHRFIDEAHEASLKTDDMIDILSKPIDSSYTDSSEKSPSDKENTYAIRLEDVSYGYGDDLILRGISYNLEKGKYFGIIGNTGCGKSTLLKVIMRLVHIDDNRIYLFGRDINKISREELSNLITFMPQSPFIFNASIKENLLFGCKENVVDEDLWWALEKVCLADYIEKLDDGLDFMLNERGSNFSGGQKQRIALARVFLSLKFKSDNHIIILDEATSALDVETENTIIDNLLQLKSEDTTIISIAHRYSTLEHTDKILDMKKGIIQRTISYEKLMEEKQHEIQEL